MMMVSQYETGQRDTTTGRENRVSLTITQDHGASSDERPTTTS